MSVLEFHKGPLPGEPRSAHFLDVDGARIRYLDTLPTTHVTSEPTSTVVFLHGFASSSEIWAPVIPHLAKSHRVITLDLKGFGWSDRPRGDYSPEAQARLVLKLLELRGVERASLVGHSWGSSVALAMALAAPERVARLALYDAWVYEAQLPHFFHWARAEGVGELMFGLFYQRSPEQRVAMAFHDPRFITPPLLARMQANIGRPGTVAAALAAVRGQRYGRVEGRYRTVKTPTLLLWGREDRVSTLPYGERLARELPNAKLVTYPACGHFPMIEALDASSRDLAGFLDLGLDSGADRSAS